MYIKLISLSHIMFSPSSVCAHGYTMQTKNKQPNSGVTLTHLTMH